MGHKLFMVLLGCKPPGRYTEQHDLFFGIGNSLPSLKESMENFWPEAAGELHVDAWRTVHHVDGYTISVTERNQNIPGNNLHLFFVNLGGYRDPDFEEYHYKQLVVAKDVAEATKKSKSSDFYKNFISPHVDDKYGLDVDDIFVVEDALPRDIREKYQLLIEESQVVISDDVHIGYLKFSALNKASI